LIKFTENFDVIIVGGGINGAGIARDAALRGLKVLVLDKGELGGNTTSWSTRLIHGGLRYLEHGELRLVRESLRERDTLLRIAPHLVRPLPILIPFFAGARRRPWIIRAGMLAYDLLSFDKDLPSHKVLSPEETLEQVPGLAQKGLLGSVTYYDAQVEFTERLILENLIAARENGAVVVSRAQVNGFIIEAGGVRGVKYADKRNERRKSARAGVVINAAGPWVDSVLEKTGRRLSRLVGGTKGSHIVVARFSGAPACALYVEAGNDGRPFFVIPWNQYYLIGTTDIRYEGDPEAARIDREEIEYLLREVNRVIPQAKLNDDSILFTYSGVRPLAFTEKKDEQSITRRHFIRQQDGLDGLISIVGGKLTTYRNLAEQTVDLLGQKLGRRLPECTTATNPLPGAECSNFSSFSEDFLKRSTLPHAITDRLLRIYGTRSDEILNLVSRDSSLGQVFSVESQAIAAEIVFSFTSEMAETLTGCLMWRTMVGLNSHCGLDAIEAAAGIGKRHLGWSDQRAHEEVAAYHRYVGAPID